MSLELFRITKPEEIELPGVGEFIRTVLDTNSLVRDVEAAVEEVKAQVHLPEYGLFIVHADGRWAGLLLCLINRSAFNTACLIVQFYSGGHTATRRALMQCAADFTRAYGMDRIIGMDMNDSPEAFQRLFRAVGQPIRAATVVVFDTTTSLI